MRTRFGVAALVFALAALPPVAGQADPLPPTSTVQQRWELLAAEETVTSTKTVEIHRGSFGSMVPAPTLGLEAVGRIQGGTGQATWTVEVRSATGVLGSVVFSAADFPPGDTAFKIRPVPGATAPVTWPADPVSLKIVGAANGSILGTFTLRKASLLATQTGTIMATHGRVPLAPAQTIANTGYADVADPMLYKHETQGYAPAPTIKLRIGGAPTSYPFWAMVRLVKSDGTPVPGSEIVAAGGGGSSEIGPISLVNGETYRLQAANGGNVNWKLFSADLVFTQTTTDPLGLESVVGWYPATSTPANLTTNGARTERMLRPPANDAELSKVQWIFVAKRLSGTGTVQALPVTAGGTEQILASPSLEVSTQSYVRRAGTIPSPQLGTDWCDTKAVLAAGTTGRLAGSLFRISIRLRGTLTALDASEPAFSPNADQVKDSTVITGAIHPDAENPTWDITIRNDVNEVVQQFGGSGNSPGAHWYGTEGNAQGGVLLPDGAYTVTLSLPGMSSAVRQIFVIIDTRAPVLVALQPEQNGNTVFSSQVVAARFKGLLATEAAYVPDSLAMSLESVPFSGPGVTFDSQTGWAKISSASALTHPDSTYEYSAGVHFEDTAGNVTEYSWTFRAIESPTFSAGHVSSDTEGAIMGAGESPGSSRWEFEPHLDLTGGSATWEDGSAHPGWGTLKATVPIGDSRLLVTIDGVEQEWSTAPYVTGTTLVVYTQLLYFEESDAVAPDTDLPSSSVGVPTVEVDLPGGVERARLVLEGITTFDLAGVCADATTEPSGCSPDPLRVFVSHSFARKFDDPRALADGTETDIGAPSLIVMQKAVDPLDLGGTWRSLRPFQYQSCPVRDAEGDLWCPLEGVLYPSESPVLPPEVFSLYCVRTGFCSGLKYSALTGEVDNKYECIHPATGQDLPPACDVNSGDCTGEDSRVCEQSAVVTGEYIGSGNSSLGLKNLNFRVRMVSDWGFDDGDYDFFGLHVSTKHRNVVWLPSPDYAEPFKGFSDVGVGLGGLYPKSGAYGTPSEDALAIWTTCWVGGFDQTFYGDYQDLRDAETHDEGNHAYGAATHHAPNTNKNRTGFAQWREVHACEQGQNGVAYVRSELAELKAHLSPTPCAPDPTCEEQKGWITATWLHTERVFDWQSTLVNLILNPFNACFLSRNRKWLCNKIGFVVNLATNYGVEYKEHVEPHKVLVPNAFALFY